MNEHDQTSLSHLITNPFGNWHKLFLTVLILTGLCVPSGLKSNSKYKLNFILERHCEISLNNCCYPTSLWFSPSYCSHCAAGFVSSTRNHPHNRGLGIKLGMPRNGALTRLSPSWFPFNTTALLFGPPSPHPAGNHQDEGSWVCHLLCYQKSQGLLPISTSLGFTLGRIKSDSFFHHLLWAGYAPDTVLDTCL